MLLASLGFGSTLGNGRWHTRGRSQIVYSGSSRALCQLEKRVHCNGATPKDQALVRLELHDGTGLEELAASELPADWRSTSGATQALGDAWIATVRSLGLWVPSFVEPLERDLLLNPAHADYPSIRLVIERQPFTFDPRLFDRDA